MNYFASMYIDNELDLDEKVEFLKTIREDDALYTESLDLLEQEKFLRSDMVPVFPRVQFKEKKRWFVLPAFRPMAWAASACAAAVVVLAVFLVQSYTVPVSGSASPYRFVIYKPDVNDVEISGSFTDWKVLPLKKVGTTGYWEIELTVPKGEHRYTFILEKEKRIADPTVFAKERDDFGGENSILNLSV